MLGFLSKNLLLKTTSIVVRSRSLISSQSSALRLYGSDSRKDCDFTVSYLVDSCGLNPELAKRAGKQFHIKSAETADNMLSLLRSYGFKDGDLSCLFSKMPKLIVADPNQTLKPKLELLASLDGAVPDVLVKILVHCPEIFQCSMDNLRPSLELLKSTVHSDEMILKLLSRSRQVLTHKVSILEAKISLLREVGMPDDRIGVFLTDCPNTFSISVPRFMELLNRVLEMKFDPKNSSFTCAAVAFSELSKSTWDKKVEILKKWGWSDAHVISAFKKQPKCMMVSQKKLDAIMDYLVNTVELKSTVCCRRPYCAYL